MTKMAKAITRMHKLLITEQYVLEFMRQQKPHKPAYEYTLQDFFTYIARQQDKEELKKENRVPQEYSPERKKQKFLTEQQKTEVMSKYIQKEKKRGYRRILAEEYNVSEATIYNITS